MYVLAQGEVEVVIDGKVAVVMGEGTVVGEMQVIDPAPRVASVRARGEAVVLCIGKEAFDEVMNDRPEIARAVNRMLVRRLREARSQAAPAPPDAAARGGGR